MSQNPWVLAIRPKTLPAAIAPVLMASAMAYGDGGFLLPIAFACIVGALSIQIATNLVNDYCDFKSGADTPLRVGPVRVTQAGLIDPKTVVVGAAVFFLLAIAMALYLYMRGGAVILWIAAFSVLSGIFYTAGKKPLGYLGLGDIFVFIFFGPVAVATTYYLHTLDLNPAVMVASIAPGLLSTAILCINNLRDIQTDQKAGKRTLAVRFGRGFACAEYIACILGMSLVPGLVFAITQDHIGVLVASLTGFAAIGLIIRACTQEGAALNLLLAKTGQLLLVYTFLFSLGWILCSR